MNNKLWFLVVLLSVSASFAWRLRDDYKYWEDQVNVIASRNLDSFADIVKNDDGRKLLDALDDLRKTVQDAHTNNLRLGKVLGAFVGTIKSLSTGISITRIPRMNVIRLMVKGIDGNRDNKSYFLLEAAREWLERRIPLVGDGNRLKDLMRELVPMVVVARDTLDGMAQEFVNGVKKMITLTENSRTNQDEIKQLASDLVKNGGNSKKLEMEGNRCLEHIDSMIKDVLKNHNIETN